MGAAKIIALGMALAFLMPTPQKAQSPVQSTGTPAGQIQPYGFKTKQSVRLCSVQRVLQTETDKDGAFTLTNVPVGRYELLVGNPNWQIFNVQEVQIESGRETNVIANSKDYASGGSNCFVSLENETNIKIGAIRVGALILCQ